MRSPQRVTDNPDISVYYNTSGSVSAEFHQTDGTTSNGRITTTFNTSGSGTSLQARISTSDSTYPPTDDASLAELIEYAKDMIDHWREVKAMLEQNAASDSDSDEDSPADEANP